MATDVLYNGVKLHNVVTREWDQEAVYDPSGTDLIANHYKLRFEGVLHAQEQIRNGAPVGVRESPAWMGVQAGAIGNTAIEVYKTIRRLLEQPRGTLEVMMDGESILFCRSATARPFGASSDVDNGPKPRNVSITHVAGASVFRVSFSIECSKVECWEGAISPGNPAQMVINNRWSVSEEMDETFYTTRIIRGKLRIADSATNIMVYKYLTVPRLEHGFRRERMEFAVSEDGLTADYSVTDRQVHTAAPWPGVKIECTHTESTMTGVHFFSECNVRLEGSPEVSKQRLMTRGVQILDNRLKVLTNEYGEDFLIEQAAIVDHIGERNAIEVIMRVRYFPDEKGIVEYLTKVRCERLGKPLEVPDMAGAPAPYDPKISRTPAGFGYVPHGGTRSVAAACLFKCYLQQPCVDDHNVNKGIYDLPDSPGDEPEDIDTEIVETPPPYNPDTSKPEGNYHSSARKMYTIARMESR